MYEFGAQRYNNTLVEKIENADLAYNADARVLTERWSPDNREALYKAINIKGQSTNASTRFLQDYNEMRFSAISLSYRFEPGVHEFLNRLNIGSMTLSGHMTISVVSPLSSRSEGWITRSPARSAALYPSFLNNLPYEIHTFPLYNAYRASNAYCKLQ